MKRWLFTERTEDLNFETPIEILKKENGKDVIRNYLLNGATGTDRARTD